MIVSSLNVGSALEFPYESRYSMFRRFFIANPNTTFSGLTNYKGYYAAYKFKRWDDLYTFIMQSKLESVATSFLNDKCNLNSSAGSKHCFKCAQMGFHTNLFSVKWLTKCPIHGQKLSSYCPKCEMPWPKQNELFSRNCDTCGNQLTTEGYKNSLKYRKNADSFVDIARIETIIKESRILDNTDDNSVSKVTDFIFNKVSCLDVNYPVHCKTLGQTNESWQKPFIKQPGFEYSLSSFDLIESESKEAKQNKYKYPEHLSEMRFRVLAQLTLYINKHSKDGHTLTIDDFTSVPPYALVYPHKFCPYCFSLSIWYSLAIADSYDEITDVLSFIGKRIQGYPFYKNGLNKSNTARPIRFININGKYYNMGEKFELWSYEQTLLLMYISILRNIIHLISIPEDIKALESFYFPQEIQSDVENGFYYCSSFSEETQRLDLSAPNLVQIIQNDLERFSSWDHKCEEFNEWFLLKRKESNYILVEGAVFLSMKQIENLQLGSSKIRSLYRAAKNTTRERILRNQCPDFWGAAESQLFMRLKSEHLNKNLGFE
jgi:hypothetical protein